MSSVGLKKAKWVVNGTTTLHALVVVRILVFGSSPVDKENWDPFLPFGRVASFICGARRREMMEQRRTGLEDVRSGR